MAVLTNSSRDDADHAMDRQPPAHVIALREIRDSLAEQVAESRASLDAHLAAGGSASEWLQKRAQVKP